MEHTERRFETVEVFGHVRVKVPKCFQTDKFIRGGGVVLDGKIVHDPAHFFDAAQVAGRLVNRHYYFPTPLLKPGVKVVVAKVCVVTEMFSDGRKFTRLNIHPYASNEPAGNEPAEYDMKFSNNGDAGVPIEGGKGNVVFRKIRRPVRAPRAPEVQVATPEPVHTQPEEPRLLSLDETVAIVDYMIDVLAGKGVVIPKDSKKTEHTRACWALGQLKKGKLNLRDHRLARFQESLETHLHKFKKVS